MGVNFCGYHLFETHTLVRAKSKKKIRENIKKWNKLYQTNELNVSKMVLSLNSWLGHVKHANSYNLVNKNLNNINFLKNFI